MSCSSGAANIMIEPVQVVFGRYQVQDVTCSADIASSHNNDYFVLYNAKDAIKYHVWYNVGGAGVDPAPPGSTAIMVAIAVNATAIAVASATATAIEAVQGFAACASGAVVTIENTQPGLSTTVAAGVGLVGFSYALVLAGDDNDMGYSDGDIEVTFDEQLLDVQAHQTGTDIIAALRQGKVAEVTVNMKEVDIDNLKLLFKQAGELYTPSGGTEVVGWGTSTNSENVITKAGKLVLHPVKNGDYFGGSPDYTRDLAFWKAHLRPESITYSGENPEIVSCTFKIYTDDRKTEEVNLFLFGNHTQAFDNQ